VDHGILIRQLEDDFGNLGLCSQCILSYLTDRKLACCPCWKLDPSDGYCPLWSSSRISPWANIVHGVPTPIGRLYECFGIGFHQYVDDTQLHTRLSIQTFNALDRLRQCIDVLQRWFWQNCTLLNPGNSVVVYFCTRLPSHEAILDSKLSTS
jgi:hypothetical protein